MTTEGRTMSDTTEQRFRAGDSIHHAPSGEDWVLACDQERDEIVCAGWPETLAKTSDCTLKQAATDEKRMEMLRNVAGHAGGGLRASWARRQLAALEPKVPTLAEDIAAVLNKHSAENGSDTPDFILAKFLVECLATFDRTIGARARWSDRDVVRKAASVPDGQAESADTGAGP